MPQAVLEAPAALPGPSSLGVQGGWRLLRAMAATAQAMTALALGGPPGEAVSAWSRRVLAALRIQVRVEGDLPGTAPLWTANHLSWLDPLVLLSLRPMGVLAKQEVSRYPFLGPAAVRAGLRFVGREDPLSRAVALVGLSQDLRRGRDLLIFPEGTTTRGQHLARVHPGGLLAAHRLGLRTLPLRLDCPSASYPWIGDEALLPHLRDVAASGAMTVTVTPGPALDPAALPDPFEWLETLRRHLAPRQTPMPEPPI